MDHVIIVAGGSGQRMGTATPKQFTLLGGRPILLRTLEKVHASRVAARIILVLPEQHFGTWSSILEEAGADIPHQVVAGGKERSFSVLNGLNAIREPGVVGIHDGVRPLASADLVRRCFDEAHTSGSAVPVVPIKASVRKRMATGSEARDRKDYLEVQTPQCFDTEKLKEAYRKSGGSQTDDATVFELAGNPVHLVEGEETNIKITTPADLLMAEAFLATE